jgi:release factor glutamine methyltransferase
VLDVGVGSGAIALAIADEHPDARVVATDSSPGALAVADENRRSAALTGQVELVQ